MQHTIIINDICNKEPEHRLDPRVIVDQEHNLLFKYAHGKQQLAQTDVETYYEYYHRGVHIEGWHGSASTQKPVEYILKFFFAVHRDGPHGHFDDRET